MTEHFYDVALASAYCSEMARSEPGGGYGEYGRLGQLVAGKTVQFNPADTGAYQQFLDTRAKSPEVHRRIELLTAFSRFESRVNALQIEVGQLSSAREHPNYLGEGLTSRGFLLPSHNDSAQYVLRVAHCDKTFASKQCKENGRLLPRPYLDPEMILDRYVAPCVVERVPGLEQMVAVSYSKNLTVSKYIPGVSLDKIEPDILSLATDTQLRLYLDTHVKAARLGIAIDANPENTVFHALDGFGMLDCRLFEPVKNPITTGARIAASVLSGLSGKSWGECTSTEPAIYTQLARLYETRRPLVLRLATICREQYPDIRTAHSTMGQTIKQSERLVQLYRNPDWIAKHVRQQQTTDLWYASSRRLRVPLSL